MLHCIRDIILLCTHALMVDAGHFAVPVCELANIQLIARRVLTATLQPMDPSSLRDA